MNKTTLLVFCFPIFGVALTGMAPELKRALGLDETHDDVAGTEGQKGELQNYPENLLGSINNITRFPHQFQSYEEARKNWMAGNIEQYTPAPITTVECHVEFQVTKSIPGRCIKLPGSIPACQTGKYIGIYSNDCI